MFGYFVLLSLCCLANARPKLFASVDVPYVIGGQDAVNGQFPWQLSMEYNNAGTWSHSCGASLLSATYSLTAAHCVDNRVAANVRIIAGLLDRNNTALTNAQTVNIASIKMHEGYSASGSYPNDFAILTHATAVDTTPANIEVATLPPDDSNAFAHSGCYISGWGRTGPSNTLPNRLQWVKIPAITNTVCNTEMSGIATVLDTHICVQSTDGQSGGCNGDSGGPLTCYATAAETGPRYVVGVTSWVIAGLIQCQTSYPTVYGRVSKFLDWIETNTP